MKTKITLKDALYALYRRDSRWGRELYGKNCVANGRKFADIEEEKIISECKSALANHPYLRALITASQQDSSEKIEVTPAVLEEIIEYDYYTGNSSTYTPLENDLKRVAREQLEMMMKTK
jgi:hypothetical protein